MYIILIVYMYLYVYVCTLSCKLKVYFGKGFQANPLGTLTTTYFLNLKCLVGTGS